MMSRLPKPPRWLDGPIEGVSPLLQPVAHALLQTVDEVVATVAPLEPAALRARPGGVAPIAFHLLHLAGASERLFAYAEGRERNAQETRRLDLEKEPDAIPLDGLVDETVTVLRRLVDRLRSFDEEELFEERAVGARALPSTVLGLLVHAGEHAQRHCGQLVTTAMVVASLPADETS